MPYMPSCTTALLPLTNHHIYTNLKFNYQLCLTGKRDLTGKKEGNNYDKIRSEITKGGRIHQ